MTDKELKLTDTETSLVIKKLGEYFDSSCDWCDEINKDNATNVEHINWKYTDK